MIQKDLKRSDVQVISRVASRKYIKYLAISILINIIQLVILIKR